MTNESGNGMVMPVSPFYGGNGSNNGGFGGDWGWIILLLLLAGGGWGMGGGFGGGYGNMMLGYDFPWLLNGQNGINSNVNDGFQNLATQNQLTAVQSDLGDIQTQLCNGFAGVNATVTNGFAQSEIADNARQMANMQQMFNVQSALQNCCCENRAGLADVKYTVATEACQSRANSTANTQAILDKLCQLELDNVKAQLESKNDTIAQLRSEVLYAKGQASQDVQTARILAGQTAEVDALYDRLNNCPVGTVPVYGRQPIFSCNNNGCGCGCSGSF